MIFPGDKFLITPWDMDLSYGCNWDINSFNGLSFYFDNYNDLDWLNSFLSNESSEIRDMISERYKNLRSTKLNTVVINDMLNSYKTFLENSGAALRDSNLWYNYNVDEEIEIIRTWIYLRINFLDDYFSNRSI